MLDKDLAELYGVETKRLKEQVRRNIDRFPDDFMFELTLEEWDALRSQIATLKPGRGQYSKFRPFVFTEQGVAMLSSVLNSKRAIEVNIRIMRIFVKMRQMISGYKELSDKIKELEAMHVDSSTHIARIYQIITELLEPAIKKRNPIGFRIGKGK